MSTSEQHNQPDALTAEQRDEWLRAGNYPRELTQDQLDLLLTVLAQHGVGSVEWSVFWRDQYPNCDEYVLFAVGGRNMDNKESYSLMRDIAQALWDAAGAETYDFLIPLSARFHKTIGHFRLDVQKRRVCRVGNVRFVVRTDAIDEDKKQSIAL